MIFTLSIPTCREGLTLPVPFATAQELVQMAVLANRLGYHSVWGNDHITPPAYVRDTFAQTPSFFEPLTILTYVAAQTRRTRRGTSARRGGAPAGCPRRSRPPTWRAGRRGYARRPRVTAATRPACTSAP